MTQPSGGDASNSNTGPFGIPPGGPWFVFPTGTIQRQSNPVAAEALTKVGWIGFPTQADAKAYADLLHQAGHAVGGAVTSTTDFLSRLTDPNTWIRVAEVALGLVLIAVCIAKLTNAVPAATKVAKGAARAGEVAAIL